MPIHDYICANCGYEIEVMHPVHGHGPTTCPQCGGPMKKTLAAPAVHFKGSGWARKDRSDAARPSRAASRAVETGSGSGSPASDAGSSSSGASTAGSASPNPSSASKDPD